MGETHKSLEETVRTQESVQKKITLKEMVKDVKMKKQMDIREEKQKIVKDNSEKVSDKDSIREEGGKKSSDSERVAVVEELNKILEVLSKPSSIKSKSKEIASLKKINKKPETSLIKIQENLLG